MRKRIRPSIELARGFAKKRNGKCLSKTCISAKQKLRWQCSKHHAPWSATYDSVKCGSWCPECSGTKKLNIFIAEQEALKRGGVCLSKRYINGKTKLKWQCSKRHKPFSACLNNVRTGHWCPYCAAPGANQTIKDMQRLAKQRGGYCLSKRYINARTKLIWSCGLSHNSWMATPDDIKSGRWCPECKKGIGERLVRKIFESIFDKNFPNTRPAFLKNPKTGNSLELDGYCKELRLGFEHHGRQHYLKSSRYSATNKMLKERRDLDSLKRKLCRQHGIVLIEIPSVPDILPLTSLLEFLYKSLDKHEIQYKKLKSLDDLSLQNVFTTSGIDRLPEMKKIAVNRGGKCLSNLYLGLHGKLRWKCANGHPEWEASPAKVLDGRWCPYCGGRMKKTIEDARKVAENFGGRLISKKYVNGKSKLVWECPSQHRWSASFDSVSRGSRCPKCYAIRRLKE